MCAVDPRSSNAAPASGADSKLAGGIRTTKQALAYLVLIDETLGGAWLDPRSVPPRRVVAARRPAAAARKGTHRPLRLTGLYRKTERMARALTYASARRKRRTAPRSRATATATSSAARSSRRAAARTFETINPATDEVPRRGRSRRPPRTSTARFAPRARPTTASGATLTPARPRRVRLPHRARDLRALARAGRARDAGQRQADQGVARLRRPDVGGALLLLRGLGRQARVRRARRPRGRARSASSARSCPGTSRC